MARKTTRGRATRKQALDSSDIVRLTSLQLVVLASIESGPKREQYGARVIDDVHRDLGVDDLPLATVYTALRRLEERGLLKSRWGAPGPDGGNKRRFYKATPAAAKAVRAVARSLSRRVGGRARR